MDSTPLPTQDFDFSDSDQESNPEFNYWVIRITSHEKFNMQELYDYMEAEPQVTKFVIGREVIPQEHFHVVMVTDSSLQLVNVKDIVRAFIVPLWQLPTAKLPKGFGNKQYNAQQSFELDKAVSYAIKLKDFRQIGFEEEYIEACLKNSFEKKKTSNFKQEYLTLVQQYQADGGLEIREFMIAFCDLKAKYGQMVNMSHAYSTAVSNTILRDKNAEEFVEKYLYNL